MLYTVKEDMLVRNKNREYLQRNRKYKKDQQEILELKNTVLKFKMYWTVLIAEWR